jgi:PAS domain S-box-containing protein
VSDSPSGPRSDGVGLGELADLLHQSCDQLQLAMVEIDATGIIRGWSEGAEQLFGYSVVEVLGRPPEAVGLDPCVSRDDEVSPSPQLTHSWLSSRTGRTEMTTPREIRVVEIRLTTDEGVADGCWRFARESQRSVERADDDALPDGLRVANSHSAEWYQLLAENSSDVTYQIDPEGNFLWVSSSAREVLDWDVAALVGQDSLSLVLDEDCEVALATRMRLLGTHGASSSRLRYLTQSGDAH